MAWKRYLFLSLWALFIAFAGAFVLALSIPVALPDPESACQVLDCHGRPVGLLQREYREPITIRQVPEFLIKALLAVEDQDFYHHQGFSPRGALRAFWYDLRAGQPEQGGSTITQQLAKNLYLNQERTITRKIKEAFYSLRLELHYSKDSILQAYLNQIYFGHGAYGIHAAARTYFNKELGDLNRREMVLLAGLPKGPALYSPYIHPDRAEERVKTVLQRMVKTQTISPIEAAAIEKEPLRLEGIQPPRVFAPYFMDFVRREAARILNQSTDEMDWSNLRIETTLDVQWQKAAETALQKHLNRLGSAKGSQPQGALVALDPKDGAIRAMVGGVDYEKSPFNRAVDAHRQPGSAFKPILYLAALETGYTLSSGIRCDPLTIKLGQHTYRPTDQGANPYHQRELRLREALTVSCNVVTVRLHEQLGRRRLVQMAKRLGIRSKLLPLPSLALGASEVTPLELARAYCVFANGGRNVSTHIVRRIKSRDGRVLFQGNPKVKPIVDPRITFLLTDTLRDVVGPNGTAASVGANLDFPVAGKTGTSQSLRDAWFAGYTPDFVGVVYVGDDRNRSLPGGGGRLAAPIWTDFAQTISRSLPARDFPIPDGIVAADICTETGMLATPFCRRMTEYYLRENCPKSYCVQHRHFNLEVCERSGLLPNRYCRHTEEREFNWGNQPTTYCNLCRKPRGFWDWLFGRFDDEDTEKEEENEEDKGQQEPRNHQQNFSERHPKYYNGPP